MSETSEKTEIILEQKETIKLMKMSKGYQWEVKITDLDVEKLAKINDDLERRYGS